MKAEYNTNKNTMIRVVTGVSVIDWAEGKCTKGGARPPRPIWKWGSVTCQVTLGPAIFQDGVIKTVGVIVLQQGHNNCLTKLTVKKAKYEIKSAIYCGVFKVTESRGKVLY